MNTGCVILKYNCRAFTISHCLFISCHYFSTAARIWLWTNTTKDTALFKWTTAEIWSNVRQSCHATLDISKSPLTFNGAPWNIQGNLPDSSVTPCTEINMSAGVGCIRDPRIVHDCHCAQWCPNTERCQAIIWHIADIRDTISPICSWYQIFRIGFTDQTSLFKVADGISGNLAVLKPGSDSIHITDWFFFFILEIGYPWVTPHTPAWISNQMPSKVRGEITYPFPNFNGQVHPTLYNGCNYLSMLGLKLNNVSKRGPGYL